MIKRILNWFVGPTVLDRPRRLPPKELLTFQRQRYVCGFAFHSTGEPNVRPKVVLIRKLKPDWQAGKLNGVGGKIEPGESPYEAMAREFCEETGVWIEPLKWDVFAEMNFPKAKVIFLRCFSPVAARARTQTVFSAELGKEIREQVEHRHVRGIDEIPAAGIIPNLRWLLPMAFHQEGGRGLVFIEYAEHN